MMRPDTVNLDHAVASFLEMREISWEMGVASLLSEGMTREEAVRQLADIWSRASVARERRWRPRRKRAPEARR
jgi:hypothetical protein